MAQHGAQYMAAAQCWRDHCRHHHYSGAILLPQLAAPCGSFGPPLAPGIPHTPFSPLNISLCSRAAWHTRGLTYLVKDVQNALSGLFLFIVVVSPAMYDSREAARRRALVQYHFPGGIPSHGGPFLDVTMTGAECWH